MAIALLRLAIQDPETNEYVRLGVTLLPEYHAREAARFAVSPWHEFVRLSVDEWHTAIGHYIAHRLFTAHEADAVRLAQEADVRKGARRGG